MDKYPANSDKAIQNLPTPSYQQKHVDAPVVKGGVQTREKSMWNNIAEFFGIKECKTFRDYVSAVSDMTNRVYGAIDTLLGNRNASNSPVPGARVQYTSYYNSQQSQPAAQAQPVSLKPSLDQYGPYYVLYDMREDAELVLARMIELISSEFRNASIDDLYDLSGITSPIGYTGANYGWTDLSVARVRPYGSKFVIDLPPAVQLR